MCVLPRQIRLQKKKGGGSSEATQYSRYSSGRYSRKQKRKRFGVGKVIALVAMLILLLLGMWGALLANSALGLRAQAQTALQGVNDIQASLTSGSYDAAVTAAQELADAALSMNDELNSPLWTPVSLLPIIGSDVNGVKTFVAAIDDVATNALLPLTQALAVSPAEGLMDDSGTIDIEALSALTDALSQAAPVMQRAADSLETVPTMNISQLEEVIGPAKEKFLGINELFQQASVIAPVIGPILGTEGDRNYLIAAQNSAEIRPSGGFPGSMGVLTISDGKMSLGSFGRVYDVLAEGMPFELTAIEHELFKMYMDESRDAGQNADFPRVAEIWAASYRQRTGLAVDGVISVTPSMVQDILAIVGSITLSDGTVLDGTNATKVLQHELYWKYLSAANYSDLNAVVSDALFAEAASLAFGKLTSSMNSSTLISFATALLDGAANREFMVWMTSENENQSLESLDINGALGSDETAPELGVFYGLGYGSKLGWYLDVSTVVGEGVKNADGSTTYQVTTTFYNAATDQEVIDGGTYIMGGTAGFELGDAEPTMYFYAPAGGRIENMRVVKGTHEFEMLTTEYDGLQVVASPLIYTAADFGLFAGETITVTYTVTTSPNATEELKVVDTPTLTEYRVQ